MFDTPTTWLTLPDGRLRAGWRLLLFCVFCLMTLIVFQWAASAFAASFPPAAALALSAAAFLSGVCAATWLAMTFAERRPFSAVGLMLTERSLREAALGFAAGAALVGAIAGVERALSAIHFEPSGASLMEALMATGWVSGILALAAFSEELLFRGYGFQRLIEGANNSAAIVISSIAFGGVHIWNPHATKLAVANTMLAGVLLSAAYLKTRALWMPIALHFSWNWTLLLFGLPISGVRLGQTPWQAVPSSSHAWVHGGDYGPEGGIVASGMLIVGIVCLFSLMGEATPPPSENTGKRDASSGLSLRIDTEI